MGVGVEGGGQGMRMDGVDERRKFGMSFGDGCWLCNSVVCGGQWCELEGVSFVVSYIVVFESEVYGLFKLCVLVIWGSCCYSVIWCILLMCCRIVLVFGCGFQCM